MFTTHSTQLAPRLRIGGDVLRATRWGRVLMMGLWPSGNHRFVYLLFRYQSVQNEAARLVSGARRTTRRRVTWPTSLCRRGGVYGRSSPVSLCSLRGTPGAALDSDVYWPAPLCCVWPQDLGPTTNGPPITRTVARFIQAPAQDPLFM